MLSNEKQCYVFVESSVMNSPRWHEEGAIFHPVKEHNKIILRYHYISGLENQRFKQTSKNPKANHTKLLSFYDKTMRENGKRLVDELRNRSGNFPKRANRIV